MTEKKPTSKRKKIILSISELEKRSHDTYYSIQEHSFHEMTVFFTDNMRVDRLLYYQLVGNRGGHSEPNEFPTQTEFAVVSDKIVHYLKMGVKHYMIELIEFKLNQNQKMKIITETDFVRIVMHRAQRVNDIASLTLLEKIEASVGGLPRL